MRPVDGTGAAPPNAGSGAEIPAPAEEEELKTPETDHALVVLSQKPDSGRNKNHNKIIPTLAGRGFPY